MAVFTNVSNTVLEPGDPIRSVDIIAIKENTNYLKQFNDLTILSTQIFAASGTWTKPGGFDATDTILVVCIGGGGAGGAVRGISFSTVNSTAAGGAGGGVMCATIAYGAALSSYAITVGSGGAAVTANTNSTALTGNTGGTTSFGNLFIATGGLGGAASTSDEGVVSAIGGVTGNTAHFLGKGNGVNFVSFAGGAGRNGSSSTVTTPIPYGFTGGGGASGSAGTGTARTQNYAGGADRAFGSGGSGNATGNGANGSVVGGGGGGCSRINIVATSGAGGRGEARVYVVRGRVSAETFFGFGLGV